ncbi:nitrite reductase (NADH) large subunit [Paenibacillus cellulosilyticus]|uniref:Nitrite reductase (NADH) large subunit n=1 Tax=Paenibacillus cellulosilyticus TaxID=375489 RepID=A0A2V2YLP0_9BACL|nr:nitrite reductase large subunit NirB [Paenibacillus cellulosilyticus]PWV94535.1 nitrite reductase (NADH) large subunit [Paenibacillus cellulosilyticus]QKS45039.1 FAD-dependent oxidoreductase [Paenibacillus cellulosilyticus]
MNSKERERLVVIGNGMAGINTVENMLKLSPNAYQITVFGKEPYPNYNRIQLSYVLEKSKAVEDIILNDWDWYRDNGINLFTGTSVTAIDTIGKKVIADNGMEVPYDKLIIATGSKPFMLPVPGVDKEGIVGFRDIADCELMLRTANEYKKAAVIGGGLLGLEAAKGLLKLGMDVTVVHIFEDLMERQLDHTASHMLQVELESQGLKFATGRKTVEFLGTNRVSGLKFSDGTVLEAEFVVMAAGIQPNVQVAKAAGIEVNRGIVVDDYMRTSVPDVFAVGECNEHRGICYGLVAPLFEQGAVLAKYLVGAEVKPYEGTIVSTQLKISGVDVFSAGEFQDAADLTVVRMHDEWRRVYKKILLREGRIVGGVLVGDGKEATRLQQWIRTGTVMTEEIHGRLMGAVAAETGNTVAELRDEEIVCGCNGVTKKHIVDAINEHGLTTVEEIKVTTGASRSCGGCRPVVEQILQYVLGDKYDSAAAKKEGICGCTTLSRDEVVRNIQEKGLITSKEVRYALGWTNEEGCSKCRPAINYYLGMVWPKEHEDERDARFVNERMHANIQKDGTFGVVPRMYGGVTTPEDLQLIANVAVKYNVKLVKVTGGQRLDLLGINRDDLPKVWEELGMPSGYAYAKALRTVKTCVGSQFCRFGTKDSMGMGILLEKKFERLDMPAKFKMAVNGCPRNCAESSTKDLGIVGNEGAWEIYVGGNGGIKSRLAELLCKVTTDEELLEIASAFMQYYRETGKYLERTSDWIERIGMKTVIQTVVEDKEQRKQLAERMELALGQVKEPWKDILDNPKLRERLFESGQGAAQPVDNKDYHYYSVGTLDQYQERLGRVVQLEEQEIAVFRTSEGNVYALENRSPGPRGGTIVEGIVSGDILFDPICDWRIGLSDGQVLAPDKGQVRTYPVRVTDGEVFVGIREGVVN